jgi:hypothetical protein
MAVRDTVQFIESEMPSKRPFCNKVGVPDAEVMQPHPHLPTNHLDPVKGEFEGGCGELLSWYTLGFHHLGIN